jgi:hypothetical protein
MAGDSSRFDIVDMSRHEYNVSATIFASILGYIVPAYVLDTTGKIVLSFACGFSALAGQALWRRVVKLAFPRRKV